jgi:hypothetical protein
MDKPSSFLRRQAHSSRYRPIPARCPFPCTAPSNYAALWRAPAPETWHLGAILGTDLNHWGTAFGPTNILLHELTAAIERDDIAHAANLADRIETTHLPLERHVQGQIDSARAYFLWKREDDAVAALLGAEARAPEQVRPNPMARELTRELLKRSPLTAGRRFREMAVRLRAV